MVAPPFELGALQVTWALAFPGVAATDRGAPGTVEGTTWFDADDDAPGPMTLLAVTVKSQASPFVRPDTVQCNGPDDHVQLLDTDELVETSNVATAYDVTALPPSVPGEDHDTTASAFPGLALTPVGAVGTVAGVSDGEGVDAVDVPSTFVADTENVYWSPFVSPVTVHAVGPVVEQVSPPWPGVVESDAVTAYPVTGLPPSNAGAVHETATCRSPATPWTSSGGSGTVAGVTMPDADDERPLPPAPAATTLNRYRSPSVSPWTVQRSGPPRHVHASPPCTGVVRSRAVTVYRSIGPAPRSFGACQLTRASSPCAVTRTAIGGPGRNGGRKTLWRAPSPSWPYLSDPQQEYACPCSSAHVLSSPTVISITDRSIVVGVGTSPRSCGRPIPSSPNSLRPQHSTRPSRRRAQLWP